MKIPIEDRRLCLAIRMELAFQIGTLSEILEVLNLLLELSNQVDHDYIERGDNSNDDDATNLADHDDEMCDLKWAPVFKQLRRFAEVNKNRKQQLPMNDFVSMLLKLITVKSGLFRPHSTGFLEIPFSVEYINKRVFFYDFLKEVMGF